MSEHITGIKPPFPFFGGKTLAAPLIWERLGNVGNYVEPFAGSLAVLLSRPHPSGIETVNDLDGFICNAWRSLAADPETTAHYADWPSNEHDLHARHLWLRDRRNVLTAQLMGDPAYYDAKIAGWWLWGIAQWIGGGWCGPSGSGPWGIVQDAEGRPQFAHLGTAGQGLRDYFGALQRRLARVRVCSGDWSRIMGPSVTTNNGVTGVLLDPPYSTEEGRDMHIYAEDSGTVAHDVRAWCLAQGDDPALRIVLCGYGDAHDALLAAGWSKAAWKAHGGMGNQGNGRGRANAHEERLWCSPHCLSPRQPGLFDAQDASRCVLEDAE